MSTPRSRSRCSRCAASTVGPGDGHAHGSGNPHYWLDPKNAEIITGNILEGARARRSRERGRSTKPIASRSSTRLDGKLAEWEAKLAPLQRRAAGRLSQQLGLFRAPLPARLRRLHRAEAGRAAESPSHLAVADQPDAGAQGPHHRAPAARAGARRRLPGEADAAAKVVVLAASVGALPGAHDYLSLFDANVAALLGGGQADDRRRSRSCGRRSWWRSAWSASTPISASRCWPATSSSSTSRWRRSRRSARPSRSCSAIRRTARRPTAIRSAFTLLAAVLLAFTRAWSARIPQEALIGVIYVVAAAAAILLIDRAPQGAEHLKQILTGNILHHRPGRRSPSSRRSTPPSACCTGCCARRLAHAARSPGNSCSTRRSAWW